jgi:hypothetical protein
VTHVLRWVYVFGHTIAGIGLFIHIRRGFATDRIFKKAGRLDFFFNFTSVPTFEE